MIRVPLAGATLRTVPEWEADLRERIATDIEAEARQVLTDDASGRIEQVALLLAARIARVGQP